MSRWWPVVCTVVALGFVLGTTSAASHWQHAVRPLGPAGYAWLAGTVLTLLAVRRFPVVVVLLATASAYAYYGSGLPGGPLIVVPTIALFVLTRQRGPFVAGITAAVALVAGYLAQVVLTRSCELIGTAGFFPVWMAAVIGIGTAVRFRVAAVHARRAQADEHRHRLAEQERLQIAREVHDVVAHSLAMINVQAGVAAHVADRRPDQAKEALLNIKSASASALNDLRATLAVLRSGENKAPAPSLAQAGELFEHARAAGLKVRVYGEPGILPAPVDGAAYRILQESLTNVVRHSGAAGVDVSFERRNGALTLAVRDDGEGIGQPTPGHGLRGMGERATALGGRFDAKRVDGGFEVRAELPIEGGA